MSQEDLLKEILSWFEEAKRFKASKKTYCAHKAYSSALKACRRLFSKSGIISEEYHFVLYEMAELLAKERQLSQAEQLIQESLSLHRQQENMVGIAEDYQELADLNMRQRKFPQTIYYYRKALDLLPSEELYRRCLVYYRMVKPLSSMHWNYDALECTQRVEEIFKLAPPLMRKEFSSMIIRNQRNMKKLKILVKC